MLDVVRISGFVDRRKGLGRPTKREGRELNKFVEESYENLWFLDDIDELDEE